MTQKSKTGTAFRPSASEAGAALFIALIMLLLITIIGLAVARTQTLEVRMAANTQNRNIAEQAAEAALRFAESGLASDHYVDFTGDSTGLYTFNVSGTSPPAYLCVSTWANYAGATACSGTAYTPITYTGATLPGALAPTFIIEALPPICLSGCATNFGNRAEPLPAVFRITANGVGGDGTSSVRLQSIYH